MVVLNKIYTRTGDDGTTALATGERRPKYDLRIEAFGTIDETNAAIGAARVFIGKDEVEIANMLARIQNDLFDLGADLATPEDPVAGNALRIVDSQVVRLENDIDTLNADLTPLRSFVLPGGSHAAVMLHLARAIARRAERLLVALAAEETGKVGEPGLRYANRLSDFLFVASRWVNDRGASDTLWVPGENR